MSTEKYTAASLKYSVLIGFILVIIGEMIKLSGNGDGMLWFGILFLILSPLIAVIVATLSLLANKERKWAYVAIALILISAIGIAIASV